MSQVETFTNYGKAFQSKTIVCLIKDKLFIQQIMDILETKSHLRREESCHPETNCEHVDVFKGQWSHGRMYL